ncbi:tRNA pseudouridine(38-40) synthase TruA [Adlercreutzia murintestinalis]|uniref:tRNA pseudouridine(38-40) synthase TruA n=1 Tax=Adlercreutzia murintestinalis TaxID=2941325 RepID=UPI00203B9126|nr:tRNA pseudouridine(38-40) synthase TruA [Adlercreutzia murintestinalis]
MQVEQATYSLTLAYDGAPFAGFARQPGQLTVQGELEHALELIFRRPVETTCAGRTDAGVHALCQVVSFGVLPGEMDGRSPRSFLRSMNALTCDGISVREVCERLAGFSARFDAKAREYRYFICQQEAPPIFTTAHSWHISQPLDVAAMEAGAAHLIGEHDFKSFCMAASAVGKPTCRNVSEICFSREVIMGEPQLVVRVVGNAFLHSMVRTIVGTLVLVGRGKRRADWVRDVLAARDRTAAGENAPAQGLVLWHVEY